jgi:hypothetical protein
MIASLLLPLVVSLISARSSPPTSDVVPAIPEAVVALRGITASGLSSFSWLAAITEQISAYPDLDRLLQVGWGAASAALLLAILAGSLQSSRHRRRWERGNIAGLLVHISEDAGPAIVGLLDPQIVVPRWLLQCPTDTQELVIAHERSHLEANDAQLVTVALGLLVCMPWNLPLWWQLRRLRLAIEIDCDARILRCGYDLSRYGEILIAIAERQSTTLGMAIAMSEPRSRLEQRIRNMLRKDTKYAPAGAAALACLGIAFALGATEISPPTAGGSGESASQESAGDISTLPGYAGFYRLNDSAVMTITRNGRQLNAQLTGQPSVPIFARSNAEFSYKDKRISFITEPDGQTTSLILHQYGIDMPMKRVDAATAQQIASIKAERPYRAKPDRRGAFIILQ